MLSRRRSQDEQSSVAMLKKHQILEQAVEDYAETVHQLSKTSRGLVAANHPERYRTPFHTHYTLDLDLISTLNLTRTLKLNLILTLTLNLF